MLTVAVANTKGGTGKTTISTHLAAWFASRGEATVLADLDKQRCAYDWVGRRPEKLARIGHVDLSRDEDVPDGTTRLVVDIPAAMKREKLEEVVKSADILIIPILPSAFDESGTERFLGLIRDLKPIRKNRRAVATIGNRVKARTRASNRLDEFLGALDFPPIARLRDAQQYVTAAATGITLFDGPFRASATREDWAPLLCFLDDVAEAK